MTARMVRDTTAGTFLPETIIPTLIKAIMINGGATMAVVGTSASAGASAATPTEIFLPVKVLRWP